MKTEIYASPYRTYRTKQNSPENHADEQHVQIIVEETDLFITLTKDIDKTEIIKFCTKEIQEIRSIIKFWIKLYPESNTVWNQFNARRMLRFVSLKCARQAVSPMSALSPALPE